VCFDVVDDVVERMRFAAASVAAAVVAVVVVMVW
jgi:hypothetical protein